MPTLRPRPSFATQRVMRSAGRTRGGRPVIAVLPSGQSTTVAVPCIRGHRLGGEHRPGRVVTCAPERHRDPRDEITAELGFAGRTGTDPVPTHTAASCLATPIDRHRSRSEPTLSSAAVITRSRPAEHGA